MADANGWRRSIAAFLSGGLIAGMAVLVTFLLALGGERQRILGHLEVTEPMIGQAQVHFSDAQAHVSETENNVIAVMPIRFAQVEARLQAIEAAQLEMNRKLDAALRGR
jgi:hypothetical protein